MKCIIYTDKYAKEAESVSVKNLIIEIKPLGIKFNTITTQSNNANNVLVDEKVLDWNQVNKLDGEIAGVIVPQKEYKIKRTLYGVCRETRFQVFANTNKKRTLDTIKHEILHALSFKLNKPDLLHEYLNQGKTLEDYEEYLSVPRKTNQQKLLEIAKAFVGKDISPNDVAPDELGCAESVSEAIRKIYPDFSIIVSTKMLFDRLNNDKRFRRTTDLDAGNVIISPTGMGNGKIIGHTGIIGEDQIIYSNDSIKGTWEKNYTITSWVNRYRKIGGFPLYVFKIL